MRQRLSATVFSRIRLLHARDAGHSSWSQHAPHRLGRRMVKRQHWPWWMSEILQVGDSEGITWSSAACFIASGIVQIFLQNLAHCMFVALQLGRWRQLHWVYGVSSLKEGKIYLYVFDARVIDVRDSGKRMQHFPRLFVARVSNRN